MNPSSLNEAVELARASDVERLIIVPPFPYLEAVAKVIKKAKLGAQDMFWEEKGAYTGEVSPEELKDLCVEYVIIGHSERRQNLGETDEMVARKVKAAFDHGLTPILCIGESRADREAGRAMDFLLRQLKSGLALMPNKLPAKSYQIVIAYEPIWAIGTGTPDDPKNTLEVVKLIKEATKTLSIPVHVIYGGSVTSKNAKDFLMYNEIEGALVGGASLKGEEIKKIVKSSAQER